MVELSSTFADCGSPEDVVERSSSVLTSTIYVVGAKSAENKYVSEYTKLTDMTYCWKTNLVPLWTR